MNIERPDTPQLGQRSYVIFVNCMLLVVRPERKIVTRVRAYESMPLQ